ncbi:CRISPR-associated protein csb2, Dpsyc system [Gaiella occulta]|uniref:CRISPR-associated protein csb2, Dpsyc system n=1 Tax=Gaiella occulta TaxID=1002870 RepID=A0A7M2Z0N0_9ACTN|nr:type I-U CRISPR-associated protein Csb2 [Gaiella occulta]RDI75574.1 CRISPR-associated protein csb2, Dpsyc system [Gaiella occulta]
MIALCVDFLTGRYVATRSDDRDEPEWPPHPARLFFALVNAWADGGKDRAEEAALRWLETQPSPAVCATGSDARQMVTVYVPPNDARNAEVIPERRSRQPRSFLSVTPHHALVTFFWPGADPPPGSRQALQRLAARTTYLGHSSSLVSVRVVDEAPEPAYVPVERGGTLTMRVPAIGQLDALEHAYCVYVDSGIRGRLPCADQSYGAPVSAVTETPASVFGEMIVFRRAGSSPHVPIEAAPLIAARLRAATMSKAGAEAPEVISGHGAAGGKSERPHVAYIAMPDVGHRHADGHLLGVAAVLPRGLTDGERAAIYRALLDVTHLTLGRAGRWELARVGVDQPARGLRAETWTAAAESWATATPIELDAFPDRPFGKEAEEIVARACERIGLPAPGEVTVGPDSVFHGVPPCHAFARHRPRSSRPRRPLVHAVVRFATPVSGPVLLGTGRYLGLGLLRPFRR